MQTILIPFLFSVAFIVFFYVLYSNGYMTINAKKAVMFAGSSFKASFTSCSGYMKRVIKFKKSQKYTFILDCELTKGSFMAEILDSNKQRILTLDSSRPIDHANLEKNRRYYLIVRFKSASGHYQLTIQNEE